MKNLCSNVIVVKGNSDRLKEFKRLITFEGTVLRHKSYNDRPIYYNEWCVSNWGTFCHSEANLRYKSGNEHRYFVRSFDLPLIEWLKKVAQEFPDLDFWMMFDDEQANYFGLAKAENGRVTVNWLVLT